MFKSRDSTDLDEFLDFCDPLLNSEPLVGAELDYDLIKTYWALSHDGRRHVKEH